MVGLNFCVRGLFKVCLSFCLGDLGLHGGDGGDKWLWEREREKERDIRERKYILLCRYNILGKC